MQVPCVDSFRDTHVFVILMGTMTAARLCANGLIPLLFVALPLALAQPAVVPAKPEPRMRIFAEPATIVQKLLSASEETRRIGFRQLGVRFESFSSRTPEVGEVRLFATNLDSDEHLERVLVYRIDPETIAMVFDWYDNAWWQVGTFSSRNSVKPLIELKPAVRSADNDVIVRVRGTGTGFTQTDLAIYRLAAGRLYRVFATVEEADYDTSGPSKAGAWYFERRKLTFPVSNDTGQHFLIVHHTKASDEIPNPPDGAPPCRPKSISCSVYRWNSNTFSFVRDQAAYSTYCHSSSREPRLNIMSDCGAEP
jgi:hypothetical protein